MRILCYGTPDATQQWRQIVCGSGLAPIITDCQPTTTLILSEFMAQSWDALLVERGLEAQVLDLVGETTRWMAMAPPVLVLGGDTSPQETGTLVRQGAAAVLSDQELGCLPQMLQQQAQMAYLELLLSNPPTTNGQTAHRDDQTRWLKRSQELGNQLMSISLYTELLLERVGDQEAASDLERILLASRRAIELAREMRTEPDPDFVAA